MLLLIQPCSAAAERDFPFFQTAYDRKAATLQDYLKTSVMCSIMTNYSCISNVIMSPNSWNNIRIIRGYRGIIRGLRGIIIKFLRA